MVNRKFTFSVSARALVIVFSTVICLGISSGLYSWSHHRNLEIQKTEYRRRLRFLNASSHAMSSASDIMKSYHDGDTAFGLSRQKAVEDLDALKLLPRNMLETKLANLNEEYVSLYSRCIGTLSACSSDIESLGLRYTRVFDTLMQEAAKYDWRKPEDDDDDPLSNDPETVHKKTK